MNVRNKLKKSSLSKLLQPSRMFVVKVRGSPHSGTPERYSSKHWPLSQTFYLAGKAREGQTLLIIMKNRKLWSLKAFITLGQANTAQGDE
jgi:hypothetical protein